MLISCRAGRDRTGMIVALLLELAGVDRHAIKDDYAQSPPAAERPTAHRTGRTMGGSAIGDMLDHVTAAHGSVSNYLRWLGVDDQAVDTIKKHMLP